MEEVLVEECNDCPCQNNGDCQLIESLDLGGKVVCKSEGIPINCPLRECNMGPITLKLKGNAQLNV